MLNRFPQFFRHVTYNLRGGFLVRPLVIALTLGCIGALLSTFEASDPRMHGIIPHWFFPAREDPQIAQVVLGAIATSVMTVVSIVFAILLMTLTLASMQFSPRIIVSFARDLTTQWTLGIFLGTFTYCVAALPAAHTYPVRTEPVITVMLAMLLALVCVSLLLFFIHHISEAIGVNKIVDNIARETELAIDTLLPQPLVNRRRHLQPQPVDYGDELPVKSKTSGYIRYIDLKLLCTVAKEHHLAVHVTRRFGHFVPAGAALLTISKEHKHSPELEDKLREAFDIGPSRTTQQDVEYGVIQIVDIALRAISPAVNDPSTAITCVDQLSRILIHFAGRESFENLLYDPPGTLRVSVPPLDLERLVDTAFEQIRMYAKSDLVVTLRILRALGDIAQVCPDPDIRAFLSERAARVLQGASEKLTEDELREVRQRLTALQDVLESGAGPTRRRRKSPAKP